MLIVKNETAEQRGKLLDAIAQLNSYNHVLRDYIDMHEEIPQMLHAYLITDKMQEQIDFIYENYINN